MKLYGVLLFCVWVQGVLSASLYAEEKREALVGVQTFQVFSKMRDQHLSVDVWYPAKQGGVLEEVGASKVFKGMPAWRDAPIVKGFFPLVVLSHGSGSSVKGMAWIATELARAGYVVAGPNHPKTTTGDSTPEDTPKIWQRTDDLSILISFFTSDDVWQERVDASRIGALGFSLGGAAAMEIAGARADLESYAQYCERYPSMADCHWFASGVAYIDQKKVSVDVFKLHDVDQALFEQSNRDPRIKTAVLVDPSVAQAFDSNSLKQINIPLSFINLGGPTTVPVSVKADALAELAPNSSLIYIHDAVHFSFLPECRDGAAAFLKAVKETDALCDEGGQRSRFDIHQELTQAIISALANTL
ncbi:MAG: dienelactone hydrolase [Marinomonas atlantica]|nr:dienelactone hydrolase [Marinomonas atlantica]